MDVRQLRYFTAIAEQGSLTRAASVLHVAQPALSLHLRHMEEELGTALLHRSPRGVSLTEAGQILLRNARIILNQMALVQDEIRGFEKDPAGEVRIGLPGTISQTLAVPLITAAHTRFPQIKLQVSDAMSGFVQNWLIEGTVDLAIVYGRDEANGLRTTKLFEEELYLFGRAGADFGSPATGAGQPVTLEQAVGLPLILPSQGHGLRDQIDALADREELTLETTIDVDSYSNIKKLVGAGFGYSILPENAIAAEIAEGRLESRSFNAPRIRRSIYLAHAQDRPMTHAVSRVHALAAETLRDLALSGEWVGVELAKDPETGVESGAEAGHA